MGAMRRNERFRDRPGRRLRRRHRVTSQAALIGSDGCVDWLPIRTRHHEARARRRDVRDVRGCGPVTAGLLLLRLGREKRRLWLFFLASRTARTFLAGRADIGHTHCIVQKRRSRTSRRARDWRPCTVELCLIRIKLLGSQLHIWQVSRSGESDLVENALEKHFFVFSCRHGFSRMVQKALILLVATVVPGRCCTERCCPAFPRLYVHVVEVQVVLV
jgi:hypothetical protein